MKRFGALLSIIFGITVYAQERKDSASARIHFVTSGALGLVNKRFMPGLANGFIAATGLEYKLSGHSTLAGDFSLDGYGYKKASATYSLDGTMSVTTLSLFYKVNFGSGGRQPFLRAGGGLARLLVPAVSVKSGFTDIKNDAPIIGQVQVEGGLQYHLNSRYTFFAAIEREWFGKSTLLADGSLGATGLKLGFITPL